MKRDVSQKIEDLIIDTQSDILCLQELWRDIATNQAQLQDTLKDTWPFFHYGENAYFPDYKLGNAILSRFDILEHKNHVLCNRSRECRGLLETKIKISKQHFLSVYCTHLSLATKERQRELEMCIDIIKNNSPDQFIFAGDFNDWEQKFSPILRKNLGCDEVGLSISRGHFKTFPTLMPILSLDRVYFKGIRLLNAKACVQKLGPSDHRSILAEFEL